MSLFFRKSLKVGPVRLNLSRAGLGVNAVLGGARVNLSGNSGISALHLRNQAMCRTIAEWRTRLNLTLLSILDLLSA
jgi:hypothetical protein